jgi:hypothetical protein
MPLNSQQRYLRVQVALAMNPDEMISIIAHELRHAIEIADAPDVRNETGLVKLYERIGRKSGLPHCYETQAAQDAARHVRRELVA